MRRGNWFTNLTNYSQNQPVSEDKYKRCGWERRKINVRGGRIYNCASSEFADLFNGYFGARLTVTSADYLTVDETLTRERIEKFKNPMPFCSQCNLEAKNCSAIFRANVGEKNGQMSGYMERKKKWKTENKKE